MTTDISDIEDGFAHSRRGVRQKKKKAKFREGCTIPPALPKHILSMLVMFNPRSKKAIANYVEVRAREKVLHTEKIKTEHVMGRDYECWDVHTNKDRYWVVTDPTNLYSHDLFPSLDYTLSFHIGVTTRMLHSSRGAPNKAHKSRFMVMWRKWEQAADALDTAEEAEDFQTVGMRCRETLIQMVRALAKPTMVPDGETAPKRGDVVNWSSLIANSVASGQHNDAIRGHLKANAKSTWELANWLTHTSGAKRIDAIFVIDATRTVLDTFGTAMIRRESGSPEQCPECGSYSVEVEFDPDLMPNPYFSLCGHCGWERQEKGMN
jgi:hypothetical protein